MEEDDTKVTSEGVTEDIAEKYTSTPVIEHTQETNTSGECTENDNFTGICLSEISSKESELEGACALEVACFRRGIDLSYRLHPRCPKYKYIFGMTLCPNFSIKITRP